MTTAIYHQDLIIRTAKTAIEKVNALNNKGQFLRDAGRVKEALASHEEALELIPWHPQTLVNVINSRRQLCIWRNGDHLHQKLFRVVHEVLQQNEKTCIMPYDAMLIDRPPEWLTRIAISASRVWERIDDVSKYMESSISVSDMQHQVAKSRKLTIGYLSYDFRDHPMGHFNSRRH